MSRGVSLYQLKKTEISLLDSLSTSVETLGQCCGFAFSANDFFLFKQQADANRRDLAGIYECRFFSKNGEMRWRMDPNSEEDLGTLLIICESEKPPTGFTERATGLISLPNQYLVWGAAEAGDTPETLLINHRTPPMDHPLQQAKPGERLRLDTREYFGPAQGEAGKQGNWVFKEERLIGFSVDKESSSKLESCERQPAH